MKLQKRIFKFFIFFLINISYAQVNYVSISDLVGVSETTGYSVFGGFGVSFVDFDKDGYDDLTFASGDGEPVIFYKNIDGLFFVEVDFFQNPMNYSYKTRSVLWVDFDNDGDRDLFLTSDTDGNRLFEFENGNLNDITQSSGIPDENLFTYGASWGDINNDGCLDVYISNRIGGTTITNYLFQNNCNGTFTNVTEAIGLSNSPALSFCSGFFDFNSDGWQDLYVANDKNMPNYLYKNNGNGTFVDFSMFSGTNIVMDAMCVTIDDFNSDGFFDIYLTNTPPEISTPDPGCVLFKNNGDETFVNVASSSNTDLLSFSWGSNFFDATNDGDLDLYVNAQYSDSDVYPSYAFYENNGDETFNMLDNTYFFNNNYRSYGSAIGDFNNNGIQEIVVNNDFSQIPSIWENVSQTNGNFIRVNLEGVISNKDGIGSVIEISIDNQKQFRHIMCGEGYLSQNSFTEHFGIGSAQVIDYVKVKWLSGIEDILYNVSPNQTLNIVENSTLSLTDNSDHQIIAYPNPVKDVLKFNIKQPLEEIEVVSILGQSVLNVVPIYNVNELNMSHLQKGTYFVKLTNSDFSQTIRIVKE